LFDAFVWVGSGRRHRRPRLQLTHRRSTATTAERTTQ